MGDSLKELNPFRNPFSPAIGTLDYKIKKQQELLVLETKKNQDKINNITSTNLENLAK
jgi:hypothetical protein